MSEATMRGHSAVEDTTGSGWDVSVVIATHSLDNLDFLRQAVHSAQAQSVPPRKIVVSVDHNPELVAVLAVELPEVEVARNDGARRGASATRNAGAARCESAVIAFLDDDEVAEPGWLAALLPPLRQDDVVGTGGRYVPRWLHRRPDWFPDELAWVVGAHHSGMPEESERVRNVWSGNMAVKAQVFHAVDGFREDFGKSGSRSNPEDTDLCIRMAAAVPGSGWVYQPDARIHHAVPRDRSTFAFYLRRCFSEGRGKIFMRDLLPDEADVLATERGYMTRTIPNGLFGYLRRAVTELAKFGAVLLGVGAAGAGAVVSAVENKRGRNDKNWRSDD